MTSVKLILPPPGVLVTVWHVPTGIGGNRNGWKSKGRVTPSGNWIVHPVKGMNYEKVTHWEYLESEQF